MKSEARTTFVRRQTVRNGVREFGTDIVKDMVVILHCHPP